jgi:amino acid transporter
MPILALRNPSREFTHCAAGGEAATRLAAVKEASSFRQHRVNEASRSHSSRLPPSSTGCVTDLIHLPKRLLIGTPLRTERMGEALVPKRLALPLLCSDALSSNAYATEETLLVLSLGGLALLTLTPWVAAAVAALLIVVVASYRQTCREYPSGGGAYAVSRANFGPRVALVAASALLVDYVLTVAVSVAAGVANVVAAVPALAPHQVAVALAFLGVLLVVNLRGVRSSGRLFAVPTYGFVAAVLLLVTVGLVRTFIGSGPVAESASFGIQPAHQLAGLAVLALALRAFASGCTALTGVEAVSNGVPTFEPPKARNAAATLTIMGVLTVTMFGGLTALAITSGVHVVDNTSRLTGAPAGYVQRTVIAQLGAAVFGNGSVLFLALQAFTAAILVLAANTAFNGFPILASLLGSDGYLPRQFYRRGDRLVFSNGIVILGVLAGLLIVVFDASTTRLIQLYIIGVFVSFTLSQWGMVRHWTLRLRSAASSSARSAIRRSRLINGTGAVFTALVLVIVVVTKFTHGAWLVAVALPLTFLVMLRIRRHYDRIDAELQPSVRGVPLPSHVHAIVLVSKLHAPTLRTLAFARATRPSGLVALTVDPNHRDTEQLEHEWVQRGIPVPLTVLDSPFRDVTRPVLDYVARIRRDSPRDVVSVFIPEYVVEHWWQHVLHNQSALRLKTRLRFRPGVMVTSVPWQLGLPQDGEASRPEPSQPSQQAQPAGVQLKV